MKLVRLFALVGVMLLLARADTFAAEGAQAVDEAWQKAMLANDLDAIVACYAKDGVFILPGEPIAQGTEAIRKCYADVLGANKVTEATLTNTHYEMAGNVGFGWGEYTIQLTPKSGGEPMTMTGRFSVAAEKEAGKWVYAIDHASAGPMK